MDVIAQGVAALLAFFIGIIGNIFAHDICNSANTVCTKIIKGASARLAAFDQDATEEEWLADLHEHQTIIEKYQHAIGCYLAAPRMRRFALIAPFVDEAPGLAWKARPEKGKDFAQARWQSSTRALEEGFLVKSVRIWTGRKTELDPASKGFIVDAVQHLQDEQDRWLYDENYRNECRAESERRDQEIQKLSEAGYTPDQVVAEVFFKDDQPEEQLG